MKKNLIKILITGGTIDDIDYSDEKDAPKDHPSLIPLLLKQAKITENVNIDVLMQKESLFITETDRKLILRKCKESKENKIVITHGTNTMLATTRFLSKAKIRKTVVLVGSFIPANKKNSDALFNLGSAITAVQLLNQGVYISMNGKIIHADRAAKNASTKFFEEINSTFE